MAKNERFTEKVVAEKKRLLIQALHDGANSMLEAVQAAGCSYFTAWNWYKKDSEFAESWDLGKENARERFLDFAEGKLRENIAKGDNTANIFYLKTQGRLRGYQERYQIDQQVTHTLDIDEAAKRIAFALNGARLKGEAIEGNFTEIVNPLSERHELVKAGKRAGAIPGDQSQGAPSHKAYKAKQKAKADKVAAKAKRKASKPKPVA